MGPQEQLVEMGMRKFILEKTVSMDNMNLLSSIQEVQLSIMTNLI